MKNRISALFFLVMMMVIQMGNVGFSFYEVTCAKSHSTTFAFKDKGCCCKINAAKKGKKSCCKKKTSTCCTADNADLCVVKSKCCSTERHSFMSQVTDFSEINNDLQITIPVILPEITVFEIAIKSQLISYNEDRKYHCNSPPLTNYIPRIFIQSFQI